MGRGKFLAGERGNSHLNETYTQMVSSLKAKHRKKGRKVGGERENG